MTDKTSTTIAGDRNNLDSGDDAASPRNFKRRRTAIACTACRIRKSRCNGKRPRCSMCESLAIECAYEASDISTRIIVRKDYMTDVEARLKLLEAKVQKHDQLFDVSEGRLLRDNNDRPAASQAASLPPNEGHVDIIHIDATASRSAAVQELAPEEALTDGMAISFIDEEDSGYFGQTSNICFMRHISHAMILAGNNGGLTSPPQSDDYAMLDNGVVNVSRPASPNSLHHNGRFDKPHHGASLNLLPSETMTRELIEHYFSNTGRLFPYIHESTFMETYEQMVAANFTTVRRTWLGLLNMVLAMASNASAQQSLNQTGQQRIAQSDVFYQRALGLCQTQILRGTSLETVQYLLLMSQYLQGTHKSVQTWAIHGLAVKAAYSVGLHSSEASRTLPPIEREIRKRTWFGCVILDRTLSMTFGRPPAIPEDHVRLPLPQMLEDEHVGHDPDNPQLSRMARSILFYNATINLYKVTASVISTLYAGNLGCDPQLNTKEIATKTFQFEQDLDEWIQALPDFLRLVSSSSLPVWGVDDLLSTKLRVVLSLRYLNLQVLLYRPGLVRSIDQSAEDDAQPKVLRSMDQMQASHIQSCLSAAKDTITIIHSVITSGSEGKHLLGAWWFSLYYVFNAALMIFGSLLANPKHIGASNSMINQIEDCSFFMTKAVEALTQLDAGNLTIKRCIIYLEQICSIIQSWWKAATDFPEVPGNFSLLSFSNLKRGADRGALRNSVPLDLQRPDQDYDGYTAPQVQFSTTDDILTDRMYGGELELGQFFLGGQMESWTNARQ